MNNKIKNGALALLSFILGFGVALLILSVVLSVGKVATINNDALSIGEFADYLSMRKNALLLDYVEDNIHISALEELGLTVSESEVDERFNSIATVKGGYNAFEEELEMAGTSVEQYKFNIHKVILDEKAGKYFTDKQVISEKEIDDELARRDELGKSLVTIDARSVDLEEGENADELDISNIDVDRIVLQRNISIEEIFETTPKVGDRTVVTVGNKQTLVIVDAVYSGATDVNIREYIRELLKVTKAQTEYKTYIDEKVNNAKIMIK